MPNFLPSRRGSTALKLSVHSPDDEAAREARSSLPAPRMPWFLTAVLAGLVAAAVGWVLIAGITVLVWLPVRAGGLSDAISIGTQVWLLSQGGGLVLGGQRLTLVPLTLTLVLALVVSLGARTAARSALRLDRAQGVRPRAGALWRMVRNVTLVVALGYALPVTVVAASVGTDQAWRTFLGSTLLALLAGWWGASRAVGHRLRQVLPAWLAAVPRAVAAAVGVVLACGLVAGVIAVVQGYGQVDELTASLAPDTISTVLVVVVQALFGPDLLLWASSWVLGAGFTVGQGSVVSPSNTDIGLLPAIPVFGALPAEGPGAKGILWWLASGVVAGAVASVIVVRRRPRARFDETGVVGALSGILAGLVMTGLGLLSRGDLGTDRLTGLGPRPTELLVMSIALMGLSGLTVGLVWGLVRRPARATEPTMEDDEDEETTDLEGPLNETEWGDEDDFEFEDLRSEREDERGRAARSRNLSEGRRGAASEQDEDEETTDLEGPLNDTEWDGDEHEIDEADWDDLDDPGADEPDELDDSWSADADQDQDLDEETREITAESPRSADSADEPTRDLAAEPTEQLGRRRRWWRR